MNRNTVKSSINAMIRSSIGWKFILFNCLMATISNGQPISDVTSSFYSDTVLTTTTIDPNDETNERIKCETDDDCLHDAIIVGYHLDMKVICDSDLKICIIGFVTDDGSQNINNNGTTATNFNSISSSSWMNTDDDNQDSTLTTLTSFSVITTKKSSDDTIQNELDEVPYFVWILLTIPFMAITIVGVLCAKRLQSKAQDIENNLRESPINGVPVEELLTQREILNTIAASLKPPPSYEKATGIIPPSYETVLQMLQERHPSLFSTLQSSSSSSPLSIMMMMMEDNGKDSYHQTIDSLSSTNSD